MVDSSEKAFLKQLPDFRTYEDAPVTDLPFVPDDAEECFWQEPTKEKDWHDDEKIGEEYAGHYAQYVKDNPPEHPSDANLLMQVVTSMAGQGAKRFVEEIRRSEDPESLDDFTPDEIAEEVSFAMWAEGAFAFGFLCYLEHLVRRYAERTDMNAEIARNHEAYMRIRLEIKKLLLNRE